MLKLLTLAACACLLVSAVSGYGSEDSSDSDDDVVEEFEDTFPILFISLTCINFLLNLACVVQTLRYGKFRRDAKYVFVLNYIVLKTIHGGSRCVSLLMSTKLTGAKLYIPSTQLTCPIISFGTFFFEFGEVFMLTLVWVVMLSERKLLAFPSLYEDLKGGVRGASSSRRSVLITYYVLGSLFFGTLALFIRPRNPYYYFTSTRSCVLDGAVAAIVALGFMFVYCPTLFSLAQYSVVFWKVFGGQRDPIKAELSRADRSFLRFIKLNSILKVLEFVFLDVQSSNGLFFRSVMTEIFRVLGLVVIFVSAVLYLYFESAIPFLNSSSSAPPDSMQISFAPSNFEENASADLMPPSPQPGLRDQRVK